MRRESEESSDAHDLMHLFLDPWQEKRAKRCTLVRIQMAGSNRLASDGSPLSSYGKSNASSRCLSTILHAHTPFCGHTHERTVSH